MKPEMREQIIQAILASFAAVGALNFDEAMQKIESATAMFLHGIRQLQTVDQLRQLLDQMETTEEQEKIMLAAFVSAPALIGMFAGLLGEAAKADLPRPEAGRPAIDYFKRGEIVDFICAKMKEGCNLKQAKLRAAMRFQCSDTTIQRVWSKRSTATLPEPAAILDAMQKGNIPLSLTPAKEKKE
jgi:hypothetical protein